jgi:hypothetical protein
LTATTAAAPARSTPVRGTVTRIAVAAVGAYVGAQVIADVTSLKIGTFTGRAVDMGTFIYPITFTLRDVVHKALGRRAARTLVITAAAVNVFMALYLQWAARAPSDASYTLGPEFQAVLAPLWRITTCPRTATGAPMRTTPDAQEQVWKASINVSWKSSPWKAAPSGSLICS